MANGHEISQKDIYGQEILSTQGKKINYSQSDLKRLKTNAPNQVVPLKISSTSQATGLKTPFTAKVDNMYSIMGTSIGRNSMHSLDVDKDGNVELICSASTQGFGSGNFWYIMRYNSTDKSWSQAWTSMVYASNIKTIEVVDYNNDGNYEILLGFENGKIEVYNPVTMELVKSFSPVTESINSIIYADADNDSVNDIVISCPSNTYVLDAITFVKKFTINKGANYVRVGMLDSSNKNEIILSSGFIYKLIGTALTTEWNFNTSGEGYVELSDIDKDSKQEVIFAQSWYYIYVYDVDTKTTKYSIKSDLDIQALTMADTNNDGVDELFYGDGQWGEVYCHNSETGALMWSVPNPEHGVTAINYADLDNDGNKELIWGAGWTSTGADYLYIYSVAQKKLLWKSDDIVGPFYAVATGDVDGDGKQEIVAVSYESESGYGSGIIAILDAETNKLKWKSNGNFLYEVWTGLYDVCIADVDNDGNNEIVIGAGQTYTGEIWIVDGKNHTIKSNHIFSNPSISEFYSLTVDDIDNDGRKELIATSSSVLYVINPTDWSVKWSVNTGSTYSGTILRSADVNGDGNKEIIVCKGSIILINTVDHSYWKSTETNYTNFDLFDFNNDGVVDILASTSNGHIVVLDGKSQAILSDVNPETSSIVSIRAYKTGYSLYYIYSSNNKINIYQNETNCSVSQSLGTNVGEIESMKLFNSQASSTEIIIGNSISIQRMYLNVLSASSTNLTVASDENSKVSVDITTTKNWTLTSNQDWLSVSSSSGSGNATITFTAKANVWAEKRSAVITITSAGSNAQVITVTQDGAAPVLNVSTNTIALAAVQGSSNSIDITSNLNWTAVSDQSWLIVSSGQGTGNAKLTLTANANPTIIARTATITISGKGLSPLTVTVTQAAGAPVLTVSSNNLIITATPNSTKSFVIYSNVNWTVVSDQPWLNPNTNYGTNSATITLSAQQNQANEPRTATVTVSGANVATQIITVTQDAGIPILNISTNTITINKDNIGTFNIQSNISWSIVSNQTWLTTNVSSGSRNATIILSAQPNKTTSLRAASLIITGVGVLPQAITVLQDFPNAINDVDQNPTFVFSNPSKSEITVNNITADAVISVFNLNGKMFISKVTNSTSTKINVENLEKGVYIIQVSSNMGIKTHKFVKQ